MTFPTPVTRSNHLSAEEVTDVLALACAAGDADGTYPLSEHVVLHIRHGGDRPAIHLSIRDSGGRLVGYAHVDTTDAIEGASAELVVHPDHRRRGLGRALTLAAMEAAKERDPAGRLRLWAHGDHPAAGALADSLGFRRHRVLHQLRRSLYAPMDPPAFPPGVTVRAFRPGEDDEWWVRVNARSFASHPEQGRWTLADLRVRMREPWFDPAGFLLAERDGDLLGFHWTKVHGWSRPHPDRHENAGEDEDAGESADEHQHDPMGEVYVLGVDPSAQGLGLGVALTLAGLRYLRSRGLNQAMLYVDEENQRALHMYERLGFARWSTDVLFSRE